MQYLPFITPHLVDFDIISIERYRFCSYFEDKAVERTLLKSENFLLSGRWSEGQRLLVNSFDEYNNNDKPNNTKEFYCLKLEMCRATLLLGGFDYVEASLPSLYYLVKTEDQEDLAGVIARTEETVAVMKATQGRISEALEFQRLAAGHFLKYFTELPIETQIITATLFILSGDYTKSYSLIEKLKGELDDIRGECPNRRLALATLESNVLYALGKNNEAAEIILNSISEYSSNDQVSEVGIGLAKIAAIEMVRLSRYEKERFKLLNDARQVLPRIGTKTSEVTRLFFVSKMNIDLELSNVQSLDEIVDFLSQGLIIDQTIESPRYCWQAKFYEVYSAFLSQGTAHIAKDPKTATALAKRVVQFCESREGGEGINTLISIAHLATIESDNGTDENALSVVNKCFETAFEKYGIESVITRQLLSYWAFIALGREMQALIVDRFIKIFDREVLDSWLSSDVPISTTDVMLELFWLIALRSHENESYDAEQFDKLKIKVLHEWGDGHLLAHVTEIIQEAIRES